MPTGIYSEKACRAVDNFKPTNRKPAKAKPRAVALFNDLELQTLATSIGDCKATACFLQPIHTKDAPFHCIISKTGSWPRLVSQYLLKHVKQLVLTDPFATKHSLEITEFIQSFFSVHVKDLLFHSS